MKNIVILATIFVIALVDFEGFQRNPATGQLEFRFISESQEKWIGEMSSDSALEMLGGRVIDEEISDYVNHIGQKLVQVSDRSNISFEFYVVDSPVANAISFPGGKIYITTGLLELMMSEGELAAVLSHEIAHVCARHGAKSVEKKLLLFATDPISCTILELKYSRQLELEADYLGMKYMAKAGYDTSCFIDLLDTLEFAHKTGDEWALGFFETHPSNADRKAQCEKHFSEFPPKKGVRGEIAYLLVHSQFFYGFVPDKEPLRSSKGDSKGWHDGLSTELQSK